jgi:hypothetical protein
MADDIQQPPHPLITKEAMERWGNLPDDKELRIALTKRDLDNLFLAIRETIIGQSDMGAALVHASNHKTEEAQAAFNSASDHIRNAIQNIDRLIFHAMTTAEPI